jgi:hypothetical protein
MRQPNLYKRVLFLDSRFSKTGLRIFVIVLAPIIVFALLGGYIIERRVAVSPLPSGLASGLALTPLDSTIKANWIPSSDPAVKWQVASVWTGDGSQLISSKVLSPTATAADMNGLRTGDTYMVKIQTINKSGVLSDGVSATGTTDPQSPMANAAFFENFDAMPAGGDLDYNYFDVRTNDRNRPGDIHLDKTQAFVNERHFHTQVIGGEGGSAVLIRPRIPFDFTNRTGTIQFEVDMPGDLRVPGKWFEVVVSKDIVGDDFALGDINSGNFADSITFGFFRDGGGLDCMGANPGKEAHCLNQPTIIVNNGGVQHEFQTPFDISRSFFSPPNVRMPIVIKLSQTSAEMFLNGGSVAKATGFTLPFTKGNITFAHRAGYGTKISTDHFEPQIPALGFQLLHWETIQYDGPAGSYNPIVKMYVQPNCSTVVHMSHDTYGTIDNCPTVSPGGSVTLNVPDDLSQAKSARLIINNSLTTGSGTVSINGNSAPITVTNHLDLDNPTTLIQHVDHVADIPLNWLHTGSNTIQFSYDNTAATFNQVELEVIFNQQRVLGNPPLNPPPQIGVTTSTFREERINSDPMQLTGTTYIYNGGTSAPVTYNASVITPDSTWLHITPPTTGTLTSPALGGGLTPLTFSVDYTNLNPPVTGLDGDIGVIRITGGVMPMYVVVIRQFFNQDARHPTVSSFPLTTVFNKSAIPDYNGSSQQPSAATPGYRDINDDGQSMRLISPSCLATG